MYSRCFPQQRVYARMSEGNQSRWFECAICAEVGFLETDQAVQHSDKHPPMCAVCLKKLHWCPFCREWIGPTNVRLVCIRILQRLRPVTFRRSVILASDFDAT